MSANLELNQGEESEKAPESAGQRLLAVILTATLLIGAVLTYVLTPTLITRYPVDARFFESPGFIPRVSLAIVAVCALIHVVRVLRGASLDTGEDTDDGSANRPLVAIGVGLFVVYVLVVPYIGYALATFAFVAVGSLVAGISRRKSVWLALATAVILYGTFVLGLKVFFPTAALFARLS